MAHICVCLKFCGQVEGGQYNMGLYLVWWRTKLVLYLIIRPKTRYNGTARRLLLAILLITCHSITITQSELHMIRQYVEMSDISDYKTMFSFKLYCTWLVMLHLVLRNSI